MAAQTITFNVQQVPDFSTAAICVQGVLTSLSYTTFDNCPSPDLVTAPVLVNCICNNDAPVVSSILSFLAAVEYEDCDQTEVDEANSIFTANCASNAKLIVTSSSASPTASTTGAGSGFTGTSSPASSLAAFTPSPTASSGSQSSSPSSSSGSGLSTGAIVGISIGAAAGLFGFLLILYLVFRAGSASGSRKAQRNFGHSDTAASSTIMAHRTPIGVTSSYGGSVYPDRPLSYYRSEADDTASDAGTYRSGGHGAQIPNMAGFLHPGSDR